MHQTTMRKITNICNYIGDHNTTILSGMAVLGLVGTTYLAVKAKPKADEMLADKEAYVRLHYNRGLGRLERFIAVTPAYLHAILMGIGTTACILGANKISKEREAMLLSAYSYLNCSYNEYREKVKEIFGPEKEQEVKEAIAKDHYVARIVNQDDLLTIYDEYGQRYFEIERAVFNNALYNINRMYNFTGEMSLNDFYEFFDLEPIPGGDLMGWAALKDFECFGVAWIDVVLHEMEMPDDSLCYYMKFNISPAEDYSNWTMPD